ncbi:MAG: 2-oxoglutarate dehydrogenase E1 component [Myxococcales bacterium]|nr:2-oxoglutarate dehydrogenase E1 component [Myxococcales bacterium]
MSEGIPQGMVGQPDAHDWEVSPGNLDWVEALYLAYQNDSAEVDPAWRDAFARVDRGEPLWLAPPAGALSQAPVAVPHVEPGREVNGHGRTNGHTAAPVARPTSAHAEASADITGAARGPAPAASLTLIDDLDDVGAVAAHRARGGKRIRRLIEDYRELGHMAARLDPLDLLDRASNEMRLADYGLGLEDIDTIVKVDDDGGLTSGPLKNVLEHLRETYCRHIGVELAHIHDNELRSWLQHRVEATRNRVFLSRAERLQLLGKVTEAEVFEQFLQTKFLGAKRFSLEGAESLIPLVDRVIDRSASQGVREVVIAMAHRGRLNMLTTALGKPAAEVFAEFLDKASAIQWDPGGDVKYHLGYSTDRQTPSGKVHISLGFNPSHLEAVNTVVQGRVRAKQDRMGDKDRSRGLPILIHGDAAFAGQGVIYEAFNMSGLDAYNVGGTIHIVVNNQIGFTASPDKTYSTTYSTDVGRMLQVPILHVNSEDPEAVAQVVDVAVDFRQRFHRDVIIDMWCYRKLGHNEGDEPSYTQPLMYRRIATKKPVREAYVEHFANSDPGGEVPIRLEDAEAAAARKRLELEEALETAKSLQQPPIPSTFAGIWSRVRGGREPVDKQIETAVSREALETVGVSLSSVPTRFTPHPKLKRLLAMRREMAMGERPIDWGMGEALAFGSLVGEGVRVRMSGQDVRRGTFSHRHSTLIDYETGEEYTSLAHLSADQGSFEIYDSLLSEAGVLGFEYGYSLDTPDGLVLWEAQFGDFVNGAQVIIDQFLVSSEAKWRRVSGLVMLLPHGMEGQGPEHSSARLERFLNMSVNDNIQVCNLTTPAQYFHVLRRQVGRPYRKPLIMMSPKSLLRHPAAVSPLEDFYTGHFQNVIPDADVDPEKVTRVLLCSGKVYYDLAAARKEHGIDDVAIIRVEQLAPLRLDEILEALSDYKEGIECMWVQEEHRNMGAWHYIYRQLRPVLLSFFRFGGISRPVSASPATGSATRHKLEHAHLIRQALRIPPPKS